MLLIPEARAAQVMRDGRGLRSDRHPLDPAPLGPPPLHRARVLRSTPVLPAVLAGLVVVLQIAYPHLEDVARQRLTITTVVVFALASLSHAYFHRGAGFAARLALVAIGIGLLAEAVGVRTGVPFGRYRYTGSLGPALLDVPVVIPLAWLMMSYPAAVVGRRIGRSLPAAVVIAAMALAVWDLFLDPQMVAAGYWEWLQGGPSLVGIPLTNHAGWLLTALVVQALLVPAMPTSGDDRVPVALYLWTWIGSVVAHTFYFHLPLAALTGGVGMGMVVLALARSERR